MTQRVWIVAIACGLSAGLASGCMLPRGHKDNILVRVDEGDKPPPDPPPDPDPNAAAKPEQRTGSEKSDRIRHVGYATEGSSGESTPRVKIAPDDPTGPSLLSSDSVSPIFPLPVDATRAPEEGVLQALRFLLDKRLPEAVRAVERYDKADQEALLVLLPWVARFAEGGLNPAKPLEIEKFLEQLEDLSRALRPKAALTLGKVCLCRDVRGFGMIDPWPRDHAFQAGIDGRIGESMLLYVEVGNTASRPVGLLHETRLAGRLNILDSHGQRVWGDTFPAKPNSSFTQRHDYFIIFSFGVPAELRPGQYTIVVEITDQTWQGSSETPPHRTVKRRLPIEIAAGDRVHSPTRPTAMIAPARGGQR